MAERQSAISKPFIALLMAVGLMTFFVPIVTTDAPVHGRSDWAPLDFLLARADRWLPAPGPLHVHEVLYGIAAVYAFMLLALALLPFPSPQKPLLLVATLGTALSVAFLRWGYQDFSWLLYGRFNYAWIRTDHDRFVQALVGWEGFRFDAAYAVFALVMPALLLAVQGRGRSSVGSRYEQHVQLPSPGADSGDH